MKTLILSDIHGRNNWKKFNFLDYDKVILQGDFLDSYNISPKAQLDNLEEIIASLLPNSVCLAGNHDFHYLFDWEYYTGYNSSIAIRAKELLSMMNLKAACEVDDFLITHAGVTKTWYDSIPKHGISIEDNINLVWEYKPKLFSFNGKDHYGEDITQGPFWVRPRALLKDKLDCKQIVGHTYMHIPYTVKGCTFMDNSQYYSIIENGVLTTKKVES